VNSVNGVYMSVVRGSSAVMLSSVFPLPVLNLSLYQKHVTLTMTILLYFTFCILFYILSCFVLFYFRLLYSTTTSHSCH
jgi:hypothetical protein